MTAAFAIREQMNAIEEAPGKVWFWELERAVIDAGRCIECGACIAACPSDSLGIGADDMPTLVKMCTGCSLCWDFCPRGGLRYEALGSVLEELTLAGHEKVQANGGSRLPAPALIPSATQRVPGPIATGEGSPTSAPVAGTESAAHEAVAVASAHADTVVAEIPKTEWKITGNGASNGNGHNGNGQNGNGQHRGEGLAAARARYTARVTETIPGVQDGGVVSALLIALLEAGEIDGALLAKPSATEPWKGVAHLARTPEEVIACAGSFYNQTLALGHLDLKKYDLPPKPRIALVGTPCEIQGLRAMQARPFSWGASRVDAVTLTIALLCTKSFHYEGLMLQEIQEKRGISLLDIDKIDIIRGKLFLYDEQGVTLLEEPIRAFHGAALKGCDECADFLGRAADISAGSVGSGDDYSSILIWTATGQQAFQHVVPRLEIRDLERPQAIEKLDALDKTVAFANLPRPYDPQGPLFIEYAEHLRNYAGTDRAPVSYEPVRY